MRVVAVVLVAVLLVGGFAAQAATIAELVEQAARTGAEAGGRLDGQLAGQLADRLEGGVLHGRASQLHALDEPGCGRYQVVLEAVAPAQTTVLATVSFDWCEGGLPPASRKPR